MNNNKFDVITITGEKFVCCCDCGKWFPSTEAFTKFYSSTAFMLCPKCANQLEQEIRRYKVKETPAADVVEAARCENCVHSHPCQEDKTDECCDVHHAHWIKKNDFCYDSDAYCSYAEYSCSYCGIWVDDRHGLPEYCPECGKKMDKEKV